MKRKTLIMVLAVLLIMTDGVLAVGSTNYQLAWFTPLTSGGGKTSSTNYVVDFSVGQPARGMASSTNYQACLGYWCGNTIEYSIYLPLVLRVSQ